MIQMEIYPFLILLPLGTKVDKGRKNTPGMSTYSKRLFKIFWHGDYLWRPRNDFGEDQGNSGKVASRNAMGSQELGVFLIQCIISLK